MAAWPGCAGSPRLSSAGVGAASGRDNRGSACESILQTGPKSFPSCPVAPDAILANGSAALTLLLQATRIVPIVFTDVPDPVGAGFVDTLSRPGGNATGFMLFEYDMSGKWLELLKEIAPGVGRAAVLRDPAMIAGVGQFAAIQSVAPSLGVDLRPMDVRDAAEIERGVASFPSRRCGSRLGLSPRIGSRETTGKIRTGQDRAIPPRGAMGVDQRHW